MLQDEREYELEKFLKKLDEYEVAHFVLAGAVVSGKLIKSDLSERPKTIRLEDATLFTGMPITTVELLFVPYASILAWGTGNIDITKLTPGEA